MVAKEGYLDKLGMQHMPLTPAPEANAEAAHLRPARANRPCLRIKTEVEGVRGHGTGRSQVQRKHSHTTIRIHGRVRTASQQLPLPVSETVKRLLSQECEEQHDAGLLK